MENIRQAKETMKNR